MIIFKCIALVELGDVKLVAFLEEAKRHSQEVTSS